MKLAHLRRGGSVKKKTRAGVTVTARLREIETLADELLAYADEDDRLIHLADASYVMQLISDVPFLLALLRESRPDLFAAAAAEEATDG